jgi:aspartate kinase
MKVFKFGGASVRDAASLANVASILQRFQHDDLMVVVSAMGKITNALERLNIAWCEQQPEAFQLFAEIEQFHLEIIQQMDIPEEGKSRISAKACRILEDLKELILESPSASFNQNYDQVVSFGELVSTTIVSAYLLEKEISNTWLDARDLIVTSDNWRDARIQWEHTAKRVQRLKKASCYITQGFIGREPLSRLTTTLGREGSDFSASILA